MPRDDDNTHFTDYLKEPNSSSSFFKPITESEIIETCKSLRNSKSCGFDNISSVILKKIIHSIANPVTYIFNKSLVTGIFPDKLKNSQNYTRIQKRQSSFIRKLQTHFYITGIIKSVGKMCTQSSIFIFMY